MTTTATTTNAKASDLVSLSSLNDYQRSALMHSYRILRDECGLSPADALQTVKLQFLAHQEGIKFTWEYDQEFSREYGKDFYIVSSYILDDNNDFYILSSVGGVDYNDSDEKNIIETDLILESLQYLPDALQTIRMKEKSKGNDE